MTSLPAKSPLSRTFPVSVSEHHTRSKDPTAVPYLGLHDLVGPWLQRAQMSAAVLPTPDWQSEPVGADPYLPIDQEKNFPIIHLRHRAVSNSRPMYLVRWPTTLLLLVHQAKSAMHLHSQQQ